MPLKTSVLTCAIAVALLGQFTASANAVPKTCKPGYDAGKHGHFGHCYPKSPSSVGKLRDSSSLKVPHVPHLTPTIAPSLSRKRH